MQMRIINQYSKKFIMLNKIYKNEDRFDDTNNNFNLKVIIFYNNYKQVSLLPNTYI